MTPTRWSSMSPRERNKRMAIFMGHKICAWYDDPEGGEIWDSVACPLRDYVNDHAAAFEMEERIKELRLEDAYVSMLSGLIAAETFYKRLFDFVHASPDSRCLAAVQAKEGCE